MTEFTEAKTRVQVSVSCVRALKLPRATVTDDQRSRGVYYRSDCDEPALDEASRYSDAARAVLTKMLRAQGIKSPFDVAWRIETREDQLVAVYSAAITETLNDQD